MLHSAVRSGAVTHLMNSSAALRSAGVLFLKRYQLPPPVGEPRCFEAGSIPTPKGNLALSFTAVRLPVVCHMIAVLPSVKFWRSVPHSTVPSGMTLNFFPKSTQYCSAPTTSGCAKLVWLPSLFMRSWPFSRANAWNIQYA